MYGKYQKTCASANLLDFQETLSLSKTHRRDLEELESSVEKLKHSHNSQSFWELVSTLEENQKEEDLLVVVAYLRHLDVPYTAQLSHKN